MAKLKYKDDLERGALFPSGAVGMNTVKDNGLNVVAVPEEYWYGAPPDGYSRVTSGQQAQNPGYVEQNRGSWGIADNAFMTDKDWNAVQGYKQQYEAAKAAGDQAGMDAAHAAAENIRLNNYGYSGGVDGNGYNQAMAYTGRQLVVDDEEDGRGADWGSSGYLSKYQSRIDALADAILNRDPFSYDPETDPTYLQYKESYTRGGQRAMQDTLAQVSARTGGMASSYGVGASQQTFNNYMAAMADKIPELKQLAYSMYMDDLNQDRADLSMLQGLDDTAYGRFTDQRDFDYGVFRDGVSDNQWQQSFDYQKEQDALAQQNWQTQWDYQLQQDALARQDTLNKLLSGSGGNGGGKAPASVMQTIFGMGNEADVYDYLVNEGLSQGEVENYLGYSKQNGNLQERLEYENGGSDPSGESNYKPIDDDLRAMVREGYDMGEVVQRLEEAYDMDLLTREEYLKLKQKYQA